MPNYFTKFVLTVVGVKNTEVTKSEMNDAIMGFIF